MARGRPRDDHPPHGLRAAVVRLSLVVGLERASRHERVHLRRALLQPVAGIESGRMAGMLTLLLVALAVAYLGGFLPRGKAWLGPACIAVIASVHGMVTSAPDSVRFRLHLVMLLVVAAVTTRRALRARTQ